MEIINSVVTYILSFKAYVMLPIIILAFSLIFRLKLSTSIKSSLTIGIGFIGIFVIFGFFVENIGPAVKALISKTGLHMNVLDVGWPPLASIAWSFKLAPLMIIVIMAVNVLLLVLRMTRTVNIDIWNYWHFIMVGALVDAVTKNIFLSIGAVITAEIIILKIADWGAPQVNKFAGLKGIAISTLSAGSYYPIGVIGNFLLDKIPFVNRMKADPQTIKDRLGIAGEPIVIGFVMGILLGIGSGYEIKGVLELAFSIAAVMLILPVMCGILSQGLMPISEGMKEFMSKHFPDIGETYIGLDNAILTGNPAVIVTGLLLMPVALILAFVLPGINFIPLGDLANTLVLIVMTIIATNGNILRTFIIGIPIIIGQLYVASYMSAYFTTLAVNAGFKFPGYDGAITSFMDGGIALRFWLFKTFEGNPVALCFIPAVFLILFFARYILKTEEKKLIAGQDADGKPGDVK
jgi:galactitol PTS system EIIC component